MHHVFYHGSDFDGQCCAAIYMSRKYKHKLYPIEHGQKLDDTEIDTYIDIVALLDFCPDDADVIRNLMEKVPVFHWIDHHESSRRMYKEEEFEKIHTPPGVFITDSKEKPMAACELLYMHMYGCEYEKIPYYVRLIGRFDVWDHNDPQTVPFQYAMRSWLGDPRTNYQQWKKLLRPSTADHKFFQKMIEHGKYIRMFDAKEAEKKAATLCFEMNFEGHKTLAVNRTLENSLFFDSQYDKKKHDLILQFAYHGGYWKLSFRSDKVNCAKIAEKYGGRGHVGAAGAVTRELPKEIKERIFKNV